MARPNGAEVTFGGMNPAPVPPMTPLNPPLPQPTLQWSPQPTNVWANPAPRNANPQDSEALEEFGSKIPYNFSYTQPK